MTKRLQSFIKVTEPVCITCEYCTGLVTHYVNLLAGRSTNPYQGIFVAICARHFKEIEGAAAIELWEVPPVAAAKL